jgi:hypothetical protein
MRSVKCDNPLCDYELPFSPPTDRAAYLKDHHDDKYPKCGEYLLHTPDPLVDGDISHVPVVLNGFQRTDIQLINHNTHLPVLLPFIHDRMKRQKPYRSYQDMPCLFCGQGKLNYYFIGNIEGDQYAIYVCDACLLYCAEQDLFTVIQTLAHPLPNPNHESAPVVIYARAWLQHHPDLRTDPKVESE